MAAGGHVQLREQLSRRQRLRYRVQAPLDVTVLRSGIPDTLPGRSVNLGEGGIGAVLAGELTPGEAVAVEIWLPLTANPLRMRALVRHHNKLHYGMAFVGLSPAQQAAIRDWVGEAQAEVEPAVLTPVADEAKDSGFGGSGGEPPATPKRRYRWLLWLLPALLLLTALWWRWNREWQKLESGLQKTSTPTAQPPVHVPAEEMTKLVTHRVDPDYPDAARQEKLHGIILLDVVIGRDGGVANVRALNGPEILAQPAMAALKWWRFEPYRINGQAVPVETTVAVEFKP